MKNSNILIALTSAIFLFSSFVYNNGLEVINDSAIPASIENSAIPASIENINKSEKITLASLWATWWFKISVLVIFKSVLFTYIIRKNRRVKRKIANLESEITALKSALKAKKEG